MHQKQLLLLSLQQQPLLLLLQVQVLLLQFGVAVAGAAAFFLCCVVWCFWGVWTAGSVGFCMFLGFLRAERGLK